MHEKVSQEKIEMKKKKGPESFPVSGDGLVFYRQPKKLQNILYSKNREHGQMKHYLPH